MSATRDPDQILHAWLEEGPTVLPAPTVRAIEVATRATAQRRPALRRPWRPNPMPFNYKFLGAAAALAIVLVGGAMLLGPRSDQGSVGGSSPSPTLSATPVPSPTPTSDVANLLDTGTWTTYVSDRYGFSIAHPADWTEVPGDHDWSLSKDTDWLNKAAEVFYTPVDQGIRVSTWSVPYDGDRLVSWIEAYCAKQYAPCGGVTEGAQAVSMDTHDGLLLRFTNDTQAFFLVDGRIYAVAVWWADSDPAVQRYGGSRRLLEAFISTMRLLPGGPAPATNSPAPS